MRVGRAGRELVATCVALGVSLGGCAWEEGVVTAPSTTTSAGAPAPSTTTTAPADPAVTTTTAPPAGARSYTVRPGDTLYAIAQAHGVTLAQLVAANSGADPGALSVGQVLVIPAAR